MTPSADAQPIGKGTFVFGVILNTIIADLGTTAFGSAFRFRHSVEGMLWKELVISSLVAASLGYLIQQIRRLDNSATFVWVLPAIWFALGPLLREHFFVHVPEFQKTIFLFYLFTVPFIRCLAFSLGAFAARTVFSKHDRTAGPEI